MKIAIIANNYGKPYDGVGAFAQVQNSNFPEWVRSEIYTADCQGSDSSLQKFTNWGMKRVIMQAAKDCEKKQFDAILLEYPFVEWNPAILAAIKILVRKAKKAGCKFAVSLHEYERTSFLRKKIIRIISRMADMVFVSDEHMGRSVSKYNVNICVRPIPTNVYVSTSGRVSIKKQENHYVYFGLVNHAKAFDEMLEGWDRFNASGENILYVLSSSELKGIEQSHIGVRYIHNAKNEELIEIMERCSFSILPVRPEIDMKNTTFKTGAITGNICVGHFNQTYEALPFTIQMNDYSVESFAKALQKTQDLTEAERQSFSQQAREFGNRYTPMETAKTVAGALAVILEDNKVETP